MYPFLINYKSIGNRNELIAFIKSAAYYGPMHRKHDYYVQDLNEEISGIINKEAILIEFSFANAELLKTETDTTILNFISHFLGGNTQMVYEAACKRIINSINIEDNKKNEDAFAIIKEIALRVEDANLRNELNLALDNNNDNLNLFRSYLEKKDNKMIDLFFQLSEKSQLNESLIKIFVLIVYANFPEQIPPILQKVKNFNLEYKRIFFEGITNFYTQSINGSKHQIFGKEFVDFDTEVTLFKHQPKSIYPVKNESYPFNLAKFNLNNNSDLITIIEQIANSGIRENTSTIVNYIYKIYNTNIFVTNEINSALENIILKSEITESVAFAIELATKFGNENIYSVAINKAIEKGTNYFCFSLQYNLFYKLCELGFKINDTNKREMLIQFLLFNNEPIQILNYCLDTNDSRLLSIFNIAAKKCYIGDDLSRKVAESIAKNYPSKIFEACEMAKNLFMDSYKKEFIKVMIAYFPNHKEVFEKKIFEKKSI